MRLVVNVKTYNESDRWTEVTDREIDMTISDESAQNIMLGQTIDAIISGSVAEHVKKQSATEV